jgi:hypothetical protein
MKLLVFLIVLVTGYVSLEKELNYTASTPAGVEVRDFLGISHGDSVDFIRWRLRIIDNKDFELECQYGIGRPNTNGFIDEKNVKLKGTAELTAGRIILKHKSKSLAMLMLNPNIVHLLNKDSTMMIGNGGWSYTLNAMQKIQTDDVRATTFKTYFEDSVVFIGRTPCRGIEELVIGKTRPECYKKKWKITMYKDSRDANSGTYKIGSQDTRDGKWKLKKDKANNLIYSLDLNNGNTIDLLQTDENIVYIMDPKGGLMVGDHDFSYSLSKERYE